MKKWLIWLKSLFKKTEKPHIPLLDGMDYWVMFCVLNLLYDYPEGILVRDLLKNSYYIQFSTVVSSMDWIRTFNKMIKLGFIQRICPQPHLFFYYGSRYDFIYDEIIDLRNGDKAIYYLTLEGQWILFALKHGSANDL